MNMRICVAFPFFCGNNALCLIDTVLCSIIISFCVLHQSHPIHIHIYKLNTYIYVCIYGGVLLTKFKPCAIRAQNRGNRIIQVTDWEPKEMLRKCLDLATGLLNKIVL